MRSGGAQSATASWESCSRAGATLADRRARPLVADVRHATFGDVLTGQTVTWASADTLIARVSTTGLVTVVAPGTAGITARYGPAAIGTASVVVLGPVATVTLTGPLATLEVGLSTQLTGRTFDASGVPQARTITFTSSNPTVAAVSSTGLVTALSAGTTTIAAASEGRSATFALSTFVPTPVATVTLNTTSQIVAQGGTFQLVPTLRDSVGGLITGRTITYTSSVPTVATVSETGLVTVISGGTTTITATREGKSATATITNVLTSGTGFTYGGTAAQVRTFYVNVPAGATRLVVATTGAATTEDVDIMIFAPGGTTALCASEGPNLNETCTLNAPLTAGLYRIRVESFGVYNNVTVRATVTP